MELDVWTNTIIGIPIDKSFLFKTKIVKTFDHDFDETVKYSSETGEKLWESIQLKSDIIDDSELYNNTIYDADADEYDLEGATIGGYDLIYDFTTSKWYLCLSCVESNSYGLIDGELKLRSLGAEQREVAYRLPSVRDVNSFKTFLKKKGFSVASFGIWTIIQSSSF